MKKILSIVAICAALTVSCTSEDNIAADVTPPSNQPNPTNTIKASFKNNVSISIGSRAVSQQAVVKE